MTRSSPDEVRFTVPGEPQGKGRARVGTIAGKARMFTPAKTVQYESLIALSAQEAMNGSAIIEGPVMLEVIAYMPIRDSWSKKKRDAAHANEIVPTGLPDIDNCCKAICDGVNNVVWKDDRQVSDLHMKKRFSSTPRVEVIITPLAKAGSS